jgi:PDZ-binding kinase
MKKTDKIYSKRLEFEAEVLKRLDHKNIVGFRGYTQSQDGRFNLCMEAMTISLGDLLEKRFNDKGGPLEPTKIITMGHDISRALTYLHNDALLIHGDIKSFNILIRGDFQLCKLCDFGVSIPIEDDGFIDFKKNPDACYTGTDLWSAPEVFEEEPALVSTKSEIFSFGLVFYECIALCPPHTLEMVTKRALNFDETEKDESGEEVDDSEPLVGTRPLFPPDLELSDEYSDILYVFNMCTEDEPHDRPDAEKLEEIFNELNIIVID